MGTLLRRLAYLFRRSRRDADLREEIETHRALRQAQLERDGMAPEAARRASGKMLGQIATARDDIHDVWVGSADAWWQDLRGGLRAVRSRSGFTTLALLSLALCLGANLVVFTIVNALWLRPPAIPNPDRVVMVTGMNDLSGTSEGFYFAERGLAELGDQPVFEAVAGQVATSGDNAEFLPHLVIERVGHEIETVRVTSQYFTVMGLRITGRDFTTDDDRPGAVPVAIISDRLWRTVFGAAPDTIGSTVAGSPIAVRIVGVAPPAFHGARLGEQTDLWLPENVLPQVSASGQWPIPHRALPLLALARLKPGVSVSDVKRAMAASSDPKTPAFAQASLVIPIARLYGSPVGRTIVVEQQVVLWIAAAMASLVLIAGCATLMALVIAHYERRRQELAIRMALGCSRVRLVRTLMVELGGMAALGAVLALAVAAAGLRALPALSLPGGLDLGRLDLSPDWRVMTFGAIGSLVTLAIAVHAPIRRATRHGLVTDLASSSGRSTGSSLRLRRDIMALHVAATVVVLVAAGLFVRTIAYGFTRGPGFDIDRTLFAEMRIHSMASFSDAERQVRDAGNADRVTRLVAALRALPGVTAVSLGRSPIGLDQASSAATPRAFMTGPRLKTMPYSSVSVGPSYFDVLDVMRIAGRGLTEADVQNPTVTDHPASVVVTRSFAEALWPTSPTVGQTFKFVGSSYSNEVVGVVNDLSLGSLRLGNHAGIFFPTNSELSARHARTELVLSAPDPDRFVEPVRRTIAEIFPGASQVDIVTGREVITRDLGRERLGAWFFSGFGLVALVLGVGGVFGLVAYLAESRQREMGIRLALGAMPAEIVRLVVTAGVRPVVVGTVAGLAASAVLARMVDSLLIGVGGLDPATYAAAATLMLVSTSAAGLVAAWRVRRISPIDALRAE